MLNWMFESRPKDYQYYQDDLGGESYEPNLNCLEELLYLIMVLPLGLIFIIFVIVLVLVVFTYFTYKFAKNVSETGKLESPGLALSGAVVAIIFPTLILDNLFFVSEHPIITLCVSMFVIFFTLAPLTGLVWRRFKPS